MGSDDKESSDVFTLQKVFTKTVNVLDNNIRLVQYGVYTVGGLGILGALYSIRVLTKIKTIRGIPKEFLRNHSKCLGTVRQVSVEEVCAKTLEKLSKESTSLVPVPNSTRKPNFLQKWRKNFYRPRNIELPSSLKEMRRYNIYVQVDHIPTMQIFRKDAKSLDETLRLRLAGIQVFESHVESAKIMLEDQKVWFTMLRLNESMTAVDCIISQNQISNSVNQILVSRGTADLEGLDANLMNSKLYEKFFQKLCDAREKAQKQRVGVWSLIESKNWYEFWK